MFFSDNFFFSNKNGGRNQQSNKESLKTVTVLIAVFEKIYIIKKRKKQVKIGNHSLWEELFIRASMFYVKLCKNW